MRKNDVVSDVIFFLAVAMVFYILILSGQVFGGEGQVIPPSDTYPNPRIELDGKLEDTCRLTAKIVQNFLDLTDKTSQRVFAGPPHDTAGREAWLQEQADLYKQVEKTSGMLEFMSSTCLGVEIYQYRLPEEWREDKDNPKVGL